MGLSAWCGVLLDGNTSRYSGSDQVPRVRTTISRTLVNCTATSIPAVHQFASSNISTACSAC